jgi:hypothetical protein
MNRRSLTGLRKAIAALQTPAIHILGAAIDVRSGQLRKVLMSNGVQQPAPDDLTVDTLPRGCRVFEYDPSRQVLSMFRSDTDGRAHVQYVHGADEDIAVGRKPAWDAPQGEWPALFAEGKQPC